MTIPVLKVKVLPKPVVKGKMDVRFPAQFHSGTAIAVNQANGNVTLDLNYDAIQITANVPAPDMPNSYNLIWDTAKKVYSLVPFALQATSGVSSLGGQTGAVGLNTGLSMVGSTLTVTFPSNVASLGGATGALTLADGLSMVGSVLTPTERIPVYDTATALAASLTVDSSQTFLRTRGKLTVGDGGHATYLQVASNPAEPGSFALANGRYAKLIELVVTPEMFLLSTDTGDDALMWSRLFNYVNTVGAEGKCAKTKTYTFATSCAIAAPGTWRTKVCAYGATFTTTAAIWQFTVSGGGYAGGMDLEGFTFNHQNNANVKGAFKLAQAGNIRLIKPVIKAGQTTNTGYISIYITEGTPGSSATGSFWNVVQDPQIFTTTADLVPFGVLFDGSANQCRVIGGLINGNIRSVSIYPGTAPNTYSANNIVIDGVSFESGTYGVYFNGILGDANTRPEGLKVINNRFESISSAGIIFVNTDQNALYAAPELHGNMFIGTSVQISNANNIRISSRDGTQYLSGTIAFSANTTKTVTFAVNQPSTNYVISLDVPANQPFWVTSKAVGSFVINTTPAFTGTVGWTLTRLS